MSELWNARQVEAQVVECLLRRGTIHFDKLVRVPVVETLLDKMGHVSTQKAPVLCEARPSHADVRGVTES